MKNVIVRGAKRALAMAGLEMHRSSSSPRRDMEPAFWAAYALCAPHTLTSLESCYNTFKCVEYVVRRRIPGAFVECGVWRGGSALMAALALQHFGDSERELYLYDTYAGMPEPTSHDVAIGGGHATTERVKHEREDAADTHSMWHPVGVDEVRALFRRHRVDSPNVHFVVGKVEETIPQFMPAAISTLRLDTDFYASTLHELEHLYPLLSEGAPIVINDYGAWAGARQAVDEYFGDSLPLLNIVDVGERIALTHRLPLALDRTPGVQPLGNS